MDYLFATDGAFAAMLWTTLVRPLLRLLAVMAFSLVLAQILASLGWTDFIARLTAPLVRLAHLGRTAGASFSLAFFSPSASNALLAQAVTEGRMNRRELLCANIFNSTPAFFVHLPSLVAVALTFLGRHGLVYIGIVFFAAFLRTFGTAIAGYFLLPKPSEGTDEYQSTRDAVPFAHVLKRAWPQMQKRLYRMVCFTVPIYCGLYFLQTGGGFTALEAIVARHLGDAGFLRPQSLSIVVFCLAAETGAAFSAAAALIATGALDPQQAVLALLVGNIVSSPMRAFRHQLPAYSGYFSPGTALLLVGASQSLRAVTLALGTAMYALWM